MTAITPKDYYAAHSSEEKEYVRVYMARKVKAGEEVKVRYQSVTVAEDGYLVSAADSFGSDRDLLIRAADFVAKTTPAADLPLPVPKKELREERVEVIKPVSKGELINPYKLPQPRPARTDGFIVTINGRETFMSNHQLTSKFNYAGEKRETKNLLLVTINGEAPIRGVLLDQLTDFTLKDSTYTVSSGLLYRDPVSADGYVVRYANATNTDLRLSAAWSAKHDSHLIALDNQAQLKAKSRKTRLGRQSL
jgi:hypothetical protein